MESSAHARWTVAVLSCAITLTACAPAPAAAPPQPPPAEAGQRPQSPALGLVVALTTADGCDCAGSLVPWVGALSRAGITLAPSSAAHDVDLRVDRWTVEGTQVSASATLLGSDRANLLAEATSTKETATERPGDDVADEVVGILVNNADVRRYAEARAPRNDANDPPRNDNGRVAGQVVGAIVQGVQQGLQTAPAAAPAPVPAAAPAVVQAPPVAVHQHAEHHAERHTEHHAHGGAPQQHAPAQVHHVARPCKPNDKNCSR